MIAGANEYSMELLWSSQAYDYKPDYSSTNKLSKQ